MPILGQKKTLKDSNSQKVNRMDEIKLETLPQLLKDNYKRAPNEIALRFKDFGVWKPYTWADYYDHVKAFALGLTSFGAKSGDKVGIIGENQPPWYWGELAAQAIGGVCVGIFVDAVPPEIKYILEHSDAAFVIAHDQEQVDKILEIRHELPLLKKIIYWNPKGLWFYDEPMLISFEQVEERGREFEKTHPDFFEERMARGKGDDCAVICYTSGTTGLPKGAMLSHRTLIEARKAWSEPDPCFEGDDYLSFLSPAWATEQYLGVAGGFLSKFVVNFPEAAETVQTNIREIEPHILFYGARQWESINAMIHVKMANAARLNRYVYNAIMPLTYKYMDLRLKGQRIGLWGRLWEMLANILVGRPLRNKLGLNRTRYAYTAGAAVSPDIISFFQATGINVKQLYGLSETGVNTCHRDGDVDPATSGSALPYNEVKISPDGEILIRTDMMFLGYYKDPEAEKEKIDEEGWFHTGDFGYIDEKKHLIVIDRMADMKELAGGHKYSPQFTEIRLRFSPYIKDALIIGGKDQDYVTGIINIDFENVGTWAEANHISYTTFLDISQKDEVAELIEKDIEGVNRVLPEKARIKRFICLHKEFDADEAELTRTRKIRRSFVEERYKNIIDGMYTNVDEISVESEVTYQDGRKSVIRAFVKVRELEGR
jgi:long-chain acyl-CoA synthetase